MAQGNKRTRKEASGAQPQGCSSYSCPSLTLRYQLLSRSTARSGFLLLYMASVWAWVCRLRVRSGSVSVRECISSDTWEMREPAAILRAAAVSSSPTWTPSNLVRVFSRPMILSRNPSGCRGRNGISFIASLTRNTSIAAYCPTCRHLLLSEKTTKLMG